MTTEIKFKEKILAIITVLVLFLLVGVVFFSINLANRNRHRRLVEKVQALNAPVFDFDYLAWSTSTTTVPWGKRDSHTAFVFDNKMWIIGGLDASLAMENGEPNYDQAKYYNDIWYTSDGINWIMAKAKAEFPPIRSASIFEINGQLFMLGGYSPLPGIGYNTGLWISPDGINWKKENISFPWLAREGQKIVKFKNKFLMIGGVNYFTRQRFNDIWSTTDGINWTLLNKSAKWEPRWDMEISEFNNKLWLTGGMTSVDKIFGDEWVSNDGITWRLVYKDAPFGKRQGHTTIVSNGHMLLIGGITNNNDTFAEIWDTTDGVNWSNQVLNFSAREDHSSQIFNKKIWILGGMDYKYNWLNEIYFSNFSNFDGNKNNPDTINSNQIELYPGACPVSNIKNTEQTFLQTFVSGENRLPEGFTPPELVNISDLLKTDGQICLNKIAAENLVQMFSEAEKSDIKLGVTYGYRTPADQQKLFDYWVNIDGEAKALEGVARPYYSEHQLGLAVDLTGESINYLGISKKFAGTKESDWLKNNAHNFGFVLSYPENKVNITKYIYEPWHWRFVGKDIAKEMYEKQITFTEYQNY